jgi:hypothetical protein
MSYDLMVFRKLAAPKNRPDFMNWYFGQVKWSEGHSYDDPVVTNVALTNWFKEMIITFPAMNGPYAAEIDNDDYEENDHITDYCIGKDVIYIGFRWSVAEEAYYKVVELAGKHKVGFFNVNEEGGEILFPENGELIPIENMEQAKEIQTVKSWWKFW